MLGKTLSSNPLKKGRSNWCGRTDIFFSLSVCSSKARCLEILGWWGVVGKTLSLNLLKKRKDLMVWLWSQLQFSCHFVLRRLGGFDILRWWGWVRKLVYWMVWASEESVGVIVKPASIWQLFWSSGGWEIRHSWFVKLALDFFECLHKVSCWCETTLSFMLLKNTFHLGTWDSFGLKFWVVGWKGKG